jgi:hypothetical protein
MFFLHYQTFFFFFVRDMDRKQMKRKVHKSIMMKSTVLIVLHLTHELLTKNVTHYVRALFLLSHLFLSSSITSFLFTFYEKDGSLHRQ